MYKNYLYLNRLITELNPLLKGFRLLEAFSQERDKLILTFRQDTETKYLMISASQNEPFINLRDEYHRARRNTIDFFRAYLPETLLGIEIAINDRIIKFNFENIKLFFVIRGKDTNLILKDSLGKCEAFKKTGPQFEDRIYRELESQLYSSYFHRPDLNAFEVKAESHAAADKSFGKEVLSKFPFLGKEVISETLARVKDESNLEELKQNLENIIDEIESSEIAVYYDNRINKVVFSPPGFKIFDIHEPRVFPDYLSALNEYLKTKYKTEHLSGIKNTISRYLDQNLKKTSEKLNEVKGKLNDPSKEEVYRNYANLLLANIRELKKGMNKIELRDFYSGEPVTIKLNVDLDARQNVERYFEKAKNEKQSKIFMKNLFENLNKRYNLLLEFNKRYNTATSLEEYKAIMENLNLKDNQNNNTPREKEFNFKHYIIDNKYHVYVGRDSQNNDVLTLRFAKQNDYWFHARGVPGSHVVLRIENSKEVVPKPVIKKAASIAAYHSKAKTSKMAPVAYTLKKYVIKRKGMEPGKVSLQREEVVLVSPEIPQGCEFQSTDI